MMRRSFEDFAVGETWRSRTITITERDIVAFARENDPQPIHTDPVAAAVGRFNGLIASGWHVATLSMRLFVEAGGYGETPVVGMGIDELRWRRPVRPGDSLTVVREVLETLISERNPAFGLLRTRITVVNQESETVMSMVSLGQVPRRIGEAHTDADSQ